MRKPGTVLRLMATLIDVIAIKRITVLTLRLLDSVHTLNAMAMPLASAITTPAVNSSRPAPPGAFPSTTGTAMTAAAQLVTMNAHARTPATTP